MGLDLLTPIVLLVPVLPFLIVGARRAENRPYVIYFAAAFILNSLALFMGSALHVGSWNWMGKAFSIVVSVCVIYLLRGFSREELKLSLVQKPASVRPALVFLSATLVVFLAMLLVFDQGMDFSPETLAFQLTMPGFDEELAYRGVYLALLNRVFGRKWRLVGAECGPALLIVTFVFGLAHALHIGNGGVAFNAYALFWTALCGFAYGWLAERTDSLVLPIIAHNGGNALNVLMGLLRP